MAVFVWRWQTARDLLCYFSLHHSEGNFLVFFFSCSAGSLVLTSRKQQTLLVSQPSCPAPSSVTPTLPCPWAVTSPGLSARRQKNWSQDTSGVALGQHPEPALGPSPSVQSQILQDIVLAGGFQRGPELWVFNPKRVFYPKISV